MNSQTTAISVRALVKEHARGEQLITALGGVDLDVHEGEFLSVMGPSGSGKSTLLHILGGLDVPTSGSVMVAGCELGGLDDRQLTDMRRRSIGFVFQFFNLMPSMSAWENVALPRLLDGERLRSLRPHAIAVLERVGLGDRAEHRPSQLSGGQLQRVAIARALVADPAVVLADEPTGNLDSTAGGEILRLLRSCADGGGRTVVMATHDRAAASVGDRVITLVDGRVVEGERTSR